VHDQDVLASQLINLELYCQHHIGDDSLYFSLRELMNKEGIREFCDAKREPGSNVSVRETRFRTSFRIIAKQNSIQKTNQLFVLDPDFDVEYTIEGTPEFNEEIRIHQNRTGQKPEEWKKLETIYKLMAQNIKTTLLSLLAPLKELLDFIAPIREGELKQLIGLC